MKTSSVTHPPKNKMVVLHDWQRLICNGDLCAASLLSYLQYFHDWKLNTDKHNKISNDIAEIHGDKRLYSEDVYQFHTLEQFADAILNLFARNSIIAGLSLLESLGIISIHKNPNPKYKFDKKKYYKFHPEICNEWIRNNYTPDGEKIDTTENKLRSSQNKPSSFINKQDTFKKGRAITEITNKDINQSTKTSDVECLSNTHEDQKQSIETNLLIESIQPIVDALIEKGLPAKRLLYPDVARTIQRLHQAGATIEIFTNAFDIAVRTTQSNSFGINYLAKVINDLMVRSRLKKSKKIVQKLDNLSEEHVEDSDVGSYEMDLTHAQRWMSADGRDK